MDARGEDSAPRAADELEPRWTLELREFLEAVRPSIGTRVWRGARVWRRSPRIRAGWEAVLRPTGITIRIVDSESRQRWSEFDAVSDVGLSYRLRLRDQRPAMYTVIPKRAMHGANGPAELGELLRRWIYGPPGV